MSSTSAYSVLELISGLNRKNFSRKKGPVDKLIRSGIPIEWIMPEEKVCNSFSEISFEEERINDLKSIFMLLNQCSSYEELEFEIRQHKIQYDLGYFSSYDQIWRNNFVRATIKGNKEIARIISEDQSQVNILQDFDKNIQLNNSLTVYAFAQQLSRKLEMGVREVYESYNGQSSIFIGAFSSYGIAKMVNKQFPAKNDIFDLTHMLYLNSGNKVMVSNDRIYKSFVGKISGFELVNNTDYIEKLSNL